MTFTKEQIIKFIEELIIEPRKNLVKWSKITDQTATLRIGYPGQHLASLVTGVKGEKSGARGNDLSDGSEVKSCSRIDQLDKCNDCSSPVLRREEKCGSCESTDIKRNNDSKWLFTIRSEDDLKTLVNNSNLDRILLIIDDYPNFDAGNYEDIRIQIFEIYPKKPRHKRFKEIMTNYYHKLYLEHKKKSIEKTPAPKNFWPHQYQFYICNPIKIFEATIKKAYTETPELVINKWIKKEENRDEIESINMPPEILKKEEFKTILDKAKEKEIIECLKDETSYDEFKELVTDNGDVEEIQSLFHTINETLRNHLNLRDTDKISTSKTKYERRTTKANEPSPEK